MDNCLWFHIKWGIGNLTWEPLSNMDDIMALDEYLTLQDVDKVENLQRVRIPSEFNIAPAVDLPRSAWCRQDNNLPHESFVESSSRARMSYHNHPKSCLHSIM